MIMKTGISPLLILSALVLLSARNVSAFLLAPPTTHSGGRTRTTSFQNSIRHFSQIMTSLSSSSQEASAEADDMQVCQQLCDERNIKLDAVKNARDLASVAANSPIQPGRLFRMGRLGDASPQDIDLLMKTLNLKTLIDLRSPTELKDDPALMRDEVFGDFINMVWKDQRGGNGGRACVTQLEPGQLPTERRRRRRFWKRRAEKHFEEEDDDYNNNGFEEDDDEEDCVMRNGVPDCCDEPNSVPSSEITATASRKERHFISLMNEYKYVKGTVSKLRKRDLTKAVLKAPGALVSRRVRSSVKKPFLDEINDGGLPMLNELLLRFGAPGIKNVLELCADRNRHPVAFYCTAGKDRTGMIAAIILALCGVEPEDIVQDYALSANVYAEMNDHQAMVGALSQRNLDPKTFLGAPKSVMRDTLLAIEEDYGSVQEYCNWIGFGPEQQDKLVRACCSVDE